jgi:hypothetical protein
MGGERAFKAASFTYMSYCDTITTQILNGSQSSKLAKIWDQPKNRGIGADQFFDGMKPVATFPVPVQPRPGTAPLIWNRC